jgi:t-SNARE complex subunit (syntaxin)
MSMTMYRRIQDFQREMNDLQGDLKSAILSDEIREMVEHSGEAHARAENLQSELRAMLDEIQGGEQEERRFAKAALDSIMHAIDAAQKTGLGDDVPSLRARLLVFKTWADYADAYLHAALGFEME